MLPLAARACLRLVDPAVREFITGDLVERYEALRSQASVKAADRWAVRQAMAAVASNPWRPGGAQSRRRGDGLMKTLLQDLRYGVRMALKQPLYSLVVILTLALAIGANTVIFSFANLLAIRPLPLANERTLGWVFAIDPQTGNARAGISMPDFLDYRSALTTFSGVAATETGTMTMTGRGDAVRLQAERVTANLIDVWGLTLAHGRGFRPGADEPGAQREVVLSHHLWVSRFGGDPAVLGQTLTLDGQPSTVVGVLAPDIELGNFSKIDAWVPLELTRDGSRLERGLRVIGRLAPGVTLAQASAEVSQVARRLATEHPETEAGWSARVAPTREAMTGADTYTVLALLGTVVGFVLLIACANLANMVLSRGVRRRREIALRTALGASRGRVVRQILTENLLYGMTGGIVGLGCAEAGLAIIKAVAFERVFQQIVVDSNVLAFTALLALGTPVLFGLLPAFQVSRTDLNDTLKEGSARSGGSVRLRRSRSFLVISQLALAVALLVVTGLLVKSLVVVQEAPVGFDTTRLLTFQTSPPEWRYRTDASVLEYYDRLLDRLRAVSGVAGAGLTNRLPLLGSELTTVVAIDGRPAARPEDQPWAVPIVADEGYLAALGVPIESGRGFTRADNGVSEPVALVNHEMARRFWNGSDPIGAYITVGAGGAARRVRIVGVTGDVVKADREGINPQVFLALRQWPHRDLTAVVRASDPTAIQAAVATQVRGLDADVPLYLMRPMRQAIDEDLSSGHLLIGLFASFAVIALIMAASGLYAVVAYNAGQRIQEFGVRLALGAVGRDIQWMMFRQMGALVVAGLVFGLAGGRLIALLAGNLLYGVSASDPAIYGSVAAILGTVAVLSSYGPVRRACRVDPVRALRLE